MSIFLTPSELATRTGYRPNQRKRICRFLELRGIPYTTDRLGNPVVLRKDIEAPSDASTAEPNFDWLETA